MSEAKIFAGWPSTEELANGHHPLPAALLNGERTAHDPQEADEDSLAIGKTMDRLSVDLQQPFKDEFPGKPYFPHVIFFQAYHVEVSVLLPGKR